MKKTYLKPSFDLETFQVEDVMTVSLQGEGADVDVGGLM